MRCAAAAIIAGAASSASMIGVTFASARGIIDANRPRMPDGSSASTTMAIVRKGGKHVTIP